MDGVQCCLRGQKALFPGTCLTSGSGEGLLSYYLGFGFLVLQFTFLTVASLGAFNTPKGAVKLHRDMPFSRLDGLRTFYSQSMGTQHFHRYTLENAPTGTGHCRNPACLHAPGSPNTHLRSAYQVLVN